VPASPPGRARRAVRRFTLGSGPLKRGSDRLEFAARVLLAVLVLLSVPVALAVGTVVRSELQAVADQQAEQRTRTTAVALAEPAARPDVVVGGRPVVPARWTAPDGTPVEDDVPAPLGTRAGDPVPLWVTADGRRTDEPMGSWQTTQVAVVLTTLGWTGGIVVLGAAYGALCWLLGRQRDRRWAAEWAAVEPTWTRRVP
jgi:hypothetical protein